ncbi:hypothetical protein [Pseudoteredinibacter isoporae]|uniref:Uncharacterized protein n=1 Tax=Pseudoteredinibacter isoporae TaxID=570281 RepID=A0A7X0JQM7_9GAMM|nr:hypothetical protein [Pseudoteredinibacter isoporae]MBB6520498.1 hypothetical protein [Pseudoteredinibacter isoporae]NHO86065.1 hypothetical protein [Pseudoteredinibacter isoporae]NIB25484.1 hypothetical protein [Pseudoteredinibacter isoporae]
MSEKQRTQAHPELQTSPKKLDDKVLAYARRKAEANKQNHSTAWSKHWYTGAASMAVLVLAVLLYPAMQQQTVKQDLVYDVVITPEPAAAKKAKPEAIGMMAGSEDLHEEIHEEDSKFMESVTVTASPVPQEEITVKAEKRMSRSRDSLSKPVLEELVMQAGEASPEYDAFIDSVQNNEELRQRLMTIRDLADLQLAESQYRDLRKKYTGLPEELAEALMMLDEFMEELEEESEQ